MKIEEISIGNYVKVNYGLGENQIYKIVRINEDGWVDMSDESMDKDIWLGHSVKELDPVYIKDVIDKLGFEKVTDGGFDYYDVYSDEFIDVVMEEYTDGLYYIVAKDCEMSFPANSILTSCVHTLQNFLTMLNADIKIEL